jgi:hypothetical protein
VTASALIVFGVAIDHLDGHDDEDFSGIAALEKGVAFAEGNFRLIDFDDALQGIAIPRLPRSVSEPVSADECSDRFSKAQDHWEAFLNNTKTIHERNRNAVGHGSHASAAELTQAINDYNPWLADEEIIQKGMSALVHDGCADPDSFDEALMTRSHDDMILLIKSLQKELARR